LPNASQVGQENSKLFGGNLMSTFRPFAHTKVRAILGALKFFPSLLFAIVAPGAALAQNTPVIWNGGNGNWFSNPSNWVCVVGGGSCSPPNGSGVTADIGTASGSGNISGTVTVNGPVNLSDGVALGNGAPGGLRVSSAANTLTAGTLDVGLSGSGTSTLSISGGGVVMDSFVAIGGSAGSSGSATVTGKGSQWNVSNQFFVGDNGQGTLSVLSGGKVTSNSAIIGDISGSSGQINVAGMGAQWIDSGAPTIGASGHGGLTISSGGIVSTAGGTIASNTGSSGSVLVTGSGSQWNDSAGLAVNPNGSLTISKGGVVNSPGGVYNDETGAVLVTGPGSQWTNSTGLGLDGKGSLMISAGGVVSNSGGVFDGANAVVTGVGSQWNTGFIEVNTNPNGGQGTLTIQNGGGVNSLGTGYVGNFGYAGSVAVTGASSSWMNTNLQIGSGGNGNLTIQGGGSVVTTAGGFIGLFGSTGTVTVTGAISQWNLSFLEVGSAGPNNAFGTGSLTILNGGVVNGGGTSIGTFGAGTATVGRVGSKLITTNLCVGCAGPGTLLVNGGAAGSSGGTAGLDIGISTGITGTMTVTDPGTKWSDSSTFVALGQNSGQARLGVQDGATFTTTGELIVGDGGIGTLAISGGQMTDASAAVGTVSSSSGLVNVSGAGGQWNTTDNLQIGSSGQVNINTSATAAAGSLTNNGSLSIGAGSEFVVNGNLTNFSGSTLTGGTYTDSGLLQFDGANIVTNAGNVTLNGATAKITDQLGTNAFTNFTLNASGGKLTLSGNQSLTTAGGSITNSGILTIGLGSTLTVGNGTTTSTPVNFRQVTGRTTVNGILASSSSTTTPTLHIIGGFLFGTGTLGYASVVNASGTIKPGDSLTTTGILAVTGTYAQEATGILDVAIGGMTVGGQFDQLNVTGTATLNGTLNISLLGGFVPAIGDQFTILNASSVTGSFTTANGTAINGTEHFEVTVNANQLVLTVVAGAAPSQ
jgi:fibronectin-binding autotransporter adhesin